MPPRKSCAKPKPELKTGQPNAAQNANMLLISSGPKTQAGLTLSLSTSMTMLHFESNSFLIQQQMPLSKPKQSSQQKTVKFSSTLHLPSISSQLNLAKVHCIFRTPADLVLQSKLTFVGASLLLCMCIYQLK